MYEAHKETLAGGVTVTVYYSEDNDSPRNWSNIGTMICGHRNYNLGDEQVSSFDFEIECDQCDDGLVDQHEDGVRPIECEVCEGMGRVNADPFTYYKQKYGARVVLPLGLIDHSGISMWAQSRLGESHICDPGGWDSGTVGFIFDTPEGLKECWGDTPITDERIEEILCGEVRTYDNYLRGEVFGYVVENAAGDTIDSCWGYYPSDDDKMGYEGCLAAGIESARAYLPVDQLEKYPALANMQIC